jgi:hypothetical protein
LFIQPLLGPTFAVVLLHDQLTPITVVGGLLIIASVSIISRAWYKYRLRNEPVERLEKEMYGKQAIRQASTTISCFRFCLHASAPERGIAQENLL